MPCVQCTAGQKRSGLFGTKSREVREKGSGVFYDCIKYIYFGFR